MAAVGHIARAAHARRRDDHPAAGVRSVSRTRRPRSAPRRCACRRTRPTRFQTDAVLARDHAADADDLPEHAEQPDRPADPARGSEADRRGRAATPSCSIDEAYIEFGGDDVSPGAAALPQRARRPDVLEGVRPGRHARRHRHRPAAGARPGARRDAAVQHQRRGARRRCTRRSRTPSSCRATRRRCASRASGCMRPAAASASSTGRAPPTTCWCASATTAPFIEALAARKIHVRDRSKDPATPGCIRITAGMLEHTDAAIEALESVVAARQAR